MIPNLGTITTTHTGHLRFIKTSLSSLKPLAPKLMVCSYNTNGGFGAWPELFQVLPANDVMALADIWTTRSDQTHIGAWAWLHLAGISILADMEIDYIFALEGDCVITKPEGLAILFDRLIAEKGDIISAERLGPGHAGVVSYLAKAEAIHAIIKEHISTRNDPALSGAGPEGRFGAAILKLGLKCLDVKNPETAHFSYGYKGTWGDVLGMMHLHGAEKWRLGHWHKPLPERFYDKRYLPAGELAALERYWKTGETDHLVAAAYWWPEPIRNEEKESDEI